MIRVPRALRMPRVAIVPPRGLAIMTPAIPSGSMAFAPLIKTSVFFIRFTASATLSSLLFPFSSTTSFSLLDSGTTHAPLSSMNPATYRSFSISSPRISSTTKEFVSPRPIATIPSFSAFLTAGCSFTALAISLLDSAGVNVSCAFISPTTRQAFNRPFR